MNIRSPINAIEEAGLNNLLTVWKDEVRKKLRFGCFKIKRIIITVISLVA